MAASWLEAPHAPEPFEIELEGLRLGSLRVLELTAHERVSQVGGWDLLVAMPQLPPEALDQVPEGTPMTVSLPANAAGRELLHGVLTGIDDAEPRQGTIPCFRLYGAPTLALCAHRRGSTHHEDTTHRAVIDELLALHRVRVRWELSEEPKLRGYLARRDESDLEFIERLLADEGLLYWFEHDSSASPADGRSRERMVIADGPALAADVPFPLRYRESVGEGAMFGSADHVTALRLSRRATSHDALLTDYDFLHPLRPEREASRPEGQLEGLRTVHWHRAGYLRRPLTRHDAERAAEVERRTARLLRGEAHCPSLRAGKRFTLSDHPSASKNGAYHLIEVEHRGIAPELAGGEPVYRSSFTCVDADVAFRPVPLQRPRCGMESARVVGPPARSEPLSQVSDEVHTDELGRVRVQFHWDLTGTHTAWLRMAQVWQGAGMGTLFVPRVGMEVIVEYVGGDPSCPVVSGCLSNTAAPVPFALPTEATRSGIKTRSSPGGDGYNELSFEDQRGQEQVRLRAQRNLDEQVLNDHTTVVGHDQRLEVRRDQTSSVGGDRFDTIVGDALIAVDGSRYDATVGSHTVSAAESLSLSTAGALRLESASHRRDVVEADHDVHIAGSTRLTIGSDRHEHVRGDTLSVVDGRRQVVVHGDASLRVGGPDHPRSRDVFASGDHTLGAGRRLEITAEEGIVITCGSSRLELTRDAIRIDGIDIRSVAKEHWSVQQPEGAQMALAEQIEVSAPAMHFRSADAHLSLTDAADLAGASTTVRGGGAGLRLAGDAALSGGKVVVASEGASLVLDAEAKLDGAMVKLNCGGSGAGVGGSSPEIAALIQGPPEPERLLDVCVFSELGEPLPGRPFTLIAGGARIRGETDGDGHLTVGGARGAPVPNSASTAQLTVELDDESGGPTLEWTLAIAPLAPADTARGASERLRNLGIYLGPLRESVDDRLRDAIRSFQREMGLPIDGQLGPPTVAALLVAHGS